LVAHIKGAEKPRDRRTQALEILEKLDHRGAVGADPLLGDGAGILIQIPDPLIRALGRWRRADLPQPGDYAVAMCFLPQDEAARDFVASSKVHRQGRPALIGWRDVPTTMDGLGEAVIASMPVIRQCFDRPRRQLRRSGRVRAQAAGHPQADPEPAGATGRKARPAGPDRALHAELLDPHGRLQGPAAGDPGRQLL
jgi:glutamate synthase domain-containing protein 1